jgi:hypothetical protein
VIETKPPPFAFEFKWFMDELAKSEPWCSATEDDEVGRWVVGHFDVLERTLMNIANNIHSHVARQKIREIIAGPGTPRERHEVLHRFLMTL